MAASDCSSGDLHVTFKETDYNKQKPKNECKTNSNNALNHRNINEKSVKKLSNNCKYRF